VTRQIPRPAKVPKLMSAGGGVRFKDDVPAHWPKPNRQRTKCSICGRAVIKYGNGWIHGGVKIRRVPTPGAVRATLAYRDSMADIEAAVRARNDAFRALVATGMIAGDIALAMDMSRAGVVYLAGELGCTIAKADRSVKASTRLRRRRVDPDRYSLWGDDDILQRPPHRAKSG